MTSGSNNFDYFPQNRLTKFSLNDKDRQGRRNKFHSAGINNLRAGKNGAVVRRIVTFCAMRY